jgi:hypothetical protein
MFAIHDGGRAEAAAERLLHACHHLLRVNLQDIHNLIFFKQCSGSGSVFFLSSRIRIRTTAESLLHACHHLLRVNMQHI